MAQMTEWLRIMLDEIARKGEEQKQAAAEQARRETERLHQPGPTPPRN